MGKSLTRILLVMMMALLMGMVAGCNQAADGDGKVPSSDAGTNPPSADAAADLEKVTVILDYVANTNHTGMYVALSEGYYEAAGLDVEIIEPTEGATASLVAVGKGDFGISYQEDVTIALTSKEPLPIKAIATIIQHNTSGFASYRESGIHSVNDFAGKTYAGWGGPGEEAVIRAVMNEAGADFSSLNMIISDGSGFEALESRVDFMWFFEAWDNVKAAMNDFPLNYIELRQLDERLDYYTPIIITNEALMDENPELIERFLAATTKGYEYAIDNPEAAARILHSFTPDYDLELLILSQSILSPKYAEDTDRWGYMKDEVWDNYTAFMVEYGVIESTIPASDCYTNAFLGK